MRGSAGVAGVGVVLRGVRLVVIAATAARRGDGHVVVVVVRGVRLAARLPTPTHLLRDWGGSGRTVGCPVRGRVVWRRVVRGRLWGRRGRR